MPAGHQITLDTATTGADVTATAAASAVSSTTATTPVRPPPPRRAGQRRTGPLVAVTGGPLHGHWYWLADWTTLGQAASYRPTGICVQNPTGDYGWGEFWRHEPPPPPARHHDHVTLPTGDQAALCPRCGRAAPRLITWRPAHRPAPARECPRCVYPDQQAMPARDQDWYATHPDTVTVSIPAPRQPMSDLFPGSGAVGRAWTTFTDTAAADASRQAPPDNGDQREGPAA